jgi:hypothetical protein
MSISYKCVGHPNLLTGVGMFSGGEDDKGRHLSFLVG